MKTSLFVTPAFKACQRASLGLSSSDFTAATCYYPGASPPSQQINHSVHLRSVSSSVINHELRSKLPINWGDVEAERPQIWIVGNSIIWFVKLPITYYLSGGKTADFVALPPPLLNIHPSVHTVMVPAVTNGVPGSLFHSPVPGDAGPATVGVFVPSLIHSFLLGSLKCCGKHWNQLTVHTETVSYI